MSFDTARYLAAFSDEARELVQTLNEALLSFENDPACLDNIDEMFRAAHTLKGMAAAMGFGDIAGLTHRMESVLALLRRGKLVSGSELCDALFRSIDALQEMVERRSNQDDRELNTFELVWVLEMLASVGDAAKASNPERARPQAANPQHADAPSRPAARDSGTDIYRVRVALSSDCRMPNVRAFMVLNHLLPLGELLSTEPAGRALLEEDFGLSFELVLASRAPTADIDKAVRTVPEVEHVAIGPPPAESGAASEAAPQESRPAQAVPGTGPLARARQTFTVRVDTERLDHAITTARELADIHQRLVELGGESSSTVLGRGLDRATALSASLREILMEARLVPVEEIFRRFPRMVRDLAKQRGKQVRLLLSGTDTAVDRVMIDDVGDSLVHLLRNAIDHGIEQPAKRQSQGKPAQGVVSLNATHEGKDVVFEVRDDGSGMNTDVIRECAVEQGIMTEEEAAALDEDQAMELAFAPGLTTAQTVTELSGRGFGMDIVKAKLAKLGGEVRIVSERGRGTTVYLRVPRRLAGIRAKDETA